MVSAALSGYSAKLKKYNCKQNLVMTKKVLYTSHSENKHILNSIREQPLQSAEGSMTHYVIYIL